MRHARAAMKAVFKTTGGKDPVKDATATFAAGDLIFAQGDLGTEMFIIQEGEVEIVKHINGESHILSHLEKGDFFGEMALLEAVAAHRRRRRQVTEVKVARHQRLALRRDAPQEPGDRRPHHPQVLEAPARGQHAARAAGRT